MQLWLQSINFAVNITLQIGFGFEIRLKYAVTLLLHFMFSLWVTELSNADFKRIQGISELVCNQWPCGQNITVICNQSKYISNVNKPCHLDIFLTSEYRTSILDVSCSKKLFNMLYMLQFYQLKDMNIFIIVRV